MNARTSVKTKKDGDKDEKKYEESILFLFAFVYSDNSTFAVSYNI